jgi:hypothetical protein
LDLLLAVRTKKLYSKIHVERNLVNSQVQHWDDYDVLEFFF